MKPSSLLFSLLIAAQCFAQAPQKNYLVKYLFDWQTDSTNKSSVFRDVMYLEINKTGSKYYSYLKQLGNRNYDKDVLQHKPLEEIMKNQPNYFIECETQILINNFISNELKTLDNLTDQAYYLVEKVEPPKWKIESETIKILNQDCQKATTNFLGRNFIAYYTTAIPMSAGPWKFNGLPGLILKVVDTKNQFKIEATELHPNFDNSLLYKEYDNAIKISKKKLKELKKLKATDIVAFDRITYPNVSITQTNSSGNVIPVKRKIKPYNPLDLTK